MTIIPADERQKINNVVDYIVDHPAKKVWQIKKEFSLNEEEYQMISDLMMPSIRRWNAYRRAVQENTMLKSELEALRNKLEGLEWEKANGYFAAPAV